MKTVRLDSQQCTYILSVLDKRLPRVSYWGAKLDDSINPESFAATHQAPVFQGGLDEPYQLTIFPEAATGFRGVPALLGARQTQNWANRFILTDLHQKNTNEVFFVYRDQAAELELGLTLLLDHKSNVLQRKTSLKNVGDSPYDLQYCAAGAFPLPMFCSSVRKYHGNWCGEFMMETLPFSPGIIQVENRTGRTSHEHFPAMIAMEENASETGGRVFGMHLGFSGNFRCLAEQVADGSKQLQCGELFYPGEKILAPDESYESPWVYVTSSDQGLNGLSDNYHTFFRSQIETPLLKHKRPVQLNTWEAVYFDHDLEQLKAMADKAASLGIERFVLDDGWFHKRNDDTAALGDWWPDADKYPEGLTPLCNHVKGLGMEFGLWLEPEMVNEESELYSAHPDWVLGLSKHPIQRGRNQLVLNLSKEEVLDYLFEKIDGLLTKYPIDYVKWDMNRILTEPGNNGIAAVSQQTAAFYSLLDRIRSKHPSVEIESCASGGGRIDYEVLKRTERVWGSDSNDPFRRLQIQQGASFFFPPEIIGSHIGPETCHTTGRITRLSFRAAVSLCYHFGAELNILELSNVEDQELKKFITLYKEHRSLFHSGTYVRLEQLNNNRNGYGIVSKDQNEGVFFIHQRGIDDHSSPRSILLTGLDPEREYTIRLLHSDASDMPEISTRLSGQYLMEWGLAAYFTNPGSCAIFHLLACR